MPILIAHRGFRSDSGENRYIDFVRALEICSAVEFDIQLTADHEIIIFHDDDFSRIANSDLKIYQTKYSEIEKIPYFQANPEWLPLKFSRYISELAHDKRYKLINVELKEPEDIQYNSEQVQLLFEAISELIKNTSAEVVVSSFSKNMQREILNYQPLATPRAYKSGYLFEKREDFDIDLARKFNYLHPPIKLALEDELIKESLKVMGKPLNPWTFENNEQAKEILTVYNGQIYGYVSDSPAINIKVEK